MIKRIVVGKTYVFENRRVRVVERSKFLSIGKQPVVLLEYVNKNGTRVKNTIWFSETAQDFRKSARECKS